MKLPTKVRYAVRAIVELAKRDHSQPVPVKSIAKAQDVSPKYVKQLMNRLQKAGIVKGHPGISGGYTLGREPRNISLLDIYEALDESADLVPCLNAKWHCKREDRCSARTVWEELSTSIRNTLRGKTIDQLVETEMYLLGKG